MPYKRFVKKGSKVEVFKNGHAFTSHSPSKAAAHRTAGLREAAEKGTLRVAKKARKKGRIGV